MILVIVIVVAWLVILGPNLLRHRARTVQNNNSISHFHRQLRVLEHSAPEPLVAPAFRLRSADGSAAGPDGQVATVPKLSVVGADQLPRPALAFLGDPPDATPVTSPCDPPTGVPLTGCASVPDPPLAALAGSHHHSRPVVRRRRRDVLGTLVLLAGASFVVGFLPGASAAWMAGLFVTGILAAYLVLLVRLRRLEEERRRKLRFLHPVRPGSYDRVRDRWDGPDGWDGPDRGPDGWDAWDAGPDEVAPVGGRYSHPVYQAAAAR